jgi:asparagine synthase (glutamine-hydrolysing)
MAQWIPEPGGGERVSKLKRFLNVQGLPADECYRSLITSIPDGKRRKLYADDISRRISFQCTRDLGVLHFNRADAEDPLDRALYQDLKMYLPDDLLALNDRIGMHHSLELRVPFVDHEIVEFAASIPREMKIGLTGRKLILRRAMRGFLPPRILSHRKQGFASPLTSWIRSGLNQYVKETLSPQRIRRAGILNEESVMHLIDKHMDRRENNYKILFSLLMFQKWTDRYLP